jgi:hypothetical protein
MNIIIHNEEYYVVNEIEDVQALLDAGAITQEEAELWFKGISLEAQSNISLTLEVRGGGDKQQEDK